MALEMAATGVGYALLFQSFADRYLQAGKLITPFDVNLQTEQSNHLVFPNEANRQRPEVQLFRDWLFDQVKT